MGIPELQSRQYRLLLKQVRTEEPNCWLCGDPIDLTLPAGTHPWGSTLDHVVPRSEGGSVTDRGNARHAHRLCNSRRGTSSPNHQPTTSTRDW